VLKLKKYASILHYHQFSYNKAVKNLTTKAILL